VHVGMSRPLRPAVTSQSLLKTAVMAASDADGAEAAAFLHGSSQTHTVELVLIALTVSIQPARP